jgi:prolyl-tRNA synthetase
MLWSKSFIYTLKETPQEAETASHQLMLRASLVRMLMAGVYLYLPLGLKVLSNVERIIREEMDASGAAEVLLSALQPQELWQRSGRDKDIGEVMIRFVDRRKRNICLGPTHEEVITELVKSHVSSYRQLPLILYQIQTKFRDEIRPRFGLIRSCEFVMKDAYSFDQDEGGLDKNYQAMFRAYERIFKRCGLNIIVTEAEPGVMGGNVSHEFMVPAQDGEDVVNGINCIEIGHTFKLGTKYSSSLGANFLDAQGKLKPIVMGCYGIGVSRLISAIIEQNNDASGIIWPKEVSPYQVIISALDMTKADIRKLALDIYEELQKNKIEVLFDDRDERAGVKFKDAELVGMPINIVIGQATLKERKIELKMRHDKRTILVERENILKEIKEILGCKMD